MVEHFRCEDFSGNKYQWVDCKRCVIMDVVTGELKRFGKNMNAVGTFEEAKDSEFITLQGPNRNIIIEFDAIKAFKV